MQFLEIPKPLPLFSYTTGNSIRNSRGNSVCNSARGQVPQIEDNPTSSQKLENMHSNII